VRGLRAGGASPAPTGTGARFQRLCCKNCVRPSGSKRRLASRRIGGADLPRGANALAAEAAPKSWPRRFAVLQVPESITRRGISETRRTATRVRAGAGLSHFKERTGMTCAATWQGKRIAAWRKQHKLGPKTTHAGLGVLSYVIVRERQCDADFSLQSFLFAFQKFDERLTLRGLGSRFSRLAKAQP